MKKTKPAILALAVASLFGQDKTASQQTGGQSRASTAVAFPPSAEPRQAAYVLGPDDQIAIHCLDFDEMNDKPVRVDMEGFIQLPMVGRLKAAGLTVIELQDEIASQLRRYFKKPEVIVSVLEFRSQPIIVMGAVKNPGMQQVRGSIAIIEALTLAGGPDPDAGNAIRITRRKEYGPIPLPGASSDESGANFVAELDLGSVLKMRDPKENIEVKPFDVITVSRAELVYVLGEVNRPGGFVLSQRKSITAIELIAVANGLNGTAKPQSARILRPSPGSDQRTEIRVDLDRILSGKSKNLELLPNDILIVPKSKVKTVITRGLEAMVQAGMIFIYRIP